MTDQESTHSLNDLDGDGFSLEFRDSQIGISSACGNIQAGWILGRDGRFELSGPIAHTRLGCLDSMRMLETKFIRVFEESKKAKLNEDTLIIESAIGEFVFTDDK